MSDNQLKPLVFSGVQPTGQLHLGNYLGVIRTFASFEEKNECMYCIVDLHSLTAQLIHDHLAEQTQTIAAAFLACGINPEKSIIFNQSSVPQHSELAWIFNCVARVGWMTRMTQFKDKAGKDRENASLGLLAYPGLMAADILLYRATHVPVGDDQKQHLELTRDIAQKFNHDFSNRIHLLKKTIKTQTEGDNINSYFPLAEPIMSGPATRVMSLRDGSQKMSKSDPSDMSRINLTDNADQIAKKIKKAKTDPNPLPLETQDLKERPEANNLVGIYAALTEMPKQKVLDEFGGQSFSAFKEAITEILIQKITPIGQAIQMFEKDKTYINNVLKEGTQRARDRAEKTIKDVWEIIGLYRN